MGGTVGTKHCKRCVTDKPLEAFSVQNIRKEGRYPTCKACVNLRSRERYAKDPAKFNEYNRALYVADPEQGRALRKKSRDKNPETTKASRRKWQQANAGVTNSYTAEYRASKLQATPKWLTEEQRQEMVAVYELAKELQWLSSEPLEVDHIVPLQGAEVSGLHVPWNLQILPRGLNRQKTNKIEELE